MQNGTFYAIDYCCTFNVGQLFDLKIVTVIVCYYNEIFPIPCGQISTNNLPTVFGNCMWH